MKNNLREKPPNYTPRASYQLLPALTLWWVQLADELGEKKATMISPVP